MSINGRELSQLYCRAHDRMRDVDGLLPQEAFDELLKFLFYKECVEEAPESEGTTLCDDGLFRPGRAEEPEEIRAEFSSQLRSKAPWALQLWHDGAFHLSDQALVDLVRIFTRVRLTELPLDIRSTALRTFLTPEIRRGLGIYLTPEDVVRMMVQVVAPKPSEVVLDPACGSGTFLIETIKHMASSRSRSKPSIWGVDKNPRMLLLADLNLGHGKSFEFNRCCADSLRVFTGTDGEPPLGLKPNGVDVILTNPPFGVTVSRDTGLLDLFETGGLSFAQDQGRVPSEILFLEICLRLLRPSGRLGIILPRSVLTNERLAPLRKSIDRLGRLTHIVALPQETFSATGTQTTTVAAFFKKHSAKRRPSVITVRACHVSNVGYDSTGRFREGNELLKLPHRLTNGATADSEPQVIVHENIPSNESLSRSAEFLFKRSTYTNGTVLRDFVQGANTGRTPSRSAYTDEGMFIIKVGNLTGRGIDWEPRDRNFVSSSEAAKRSKTEALMVKRGDILLTSSAHSSKYIAKKVDIVDRLPSDFEAAGVTFVGEIIRVRPRVGVDPYVLLAVLRHPEVRANLQALVRGQTAHLNPSDLLTVGVPCDLTKPNPKLEKVASMLRREAELAFELSVLALDAAKLVAEVDSDASTASV